MKQLHKDILESIKTQPVRPSTRNGRVLIVDGL